MQITEMLKRENVRLADSVDTWQDAIKLAIAPLNEGGYVEDRYADEIIRATNEMGPYYVLTEDVALIHGRPEDGCIKGQLAVTVLKKPVRFSEDSFDVSPFGCACCRGFQFAYRGHAGACWHLYG